ncbi:SDR family NAD(P)-dependent oxidoreductase [Pseudokordiimonas caeni]|uniref:SDR family NAD(P)-dependent oxidoreductase n=1 Tax=Pseudokordiimonas caeni TaxID=2997908 RepID=UPI0028115743|nr:SDR family oxidoreductase [Pseudokordiimonas caeni]
MTRQTSLITGASSGIGKTYAERLARRGEDLILVARNKERLEALAAELTAETGVSVSVVVADLTRTDDVKKVADLLLADASITTLVNNAGIAGGGPVHAANPDQLDTLVDLNIKALTRLSAAAARAFAARGHGRIINIGSVTAFMQEVFEPTYLATKSYVLSFTQALQVELKDKGVTVQAVLPGVTRTEIWERAGHDLADIPAHMVMEVGDMVDASLAGLDAGEIVTIPSLPDPADFEAYETARRALQPNLSHMKPAPRYGL